MKKKRIIAIIIAVVLMTTAGVVYILRDDFFGGFFKVSADVPEQITIIVPWNPGSIADDMVRAMNFGETQIVLQNITGAYGANGLNAVYNAPHDGTTLLVTGLTEFMEAERMGFAESSSDDWVRWLVIFSPENENFYGFFVPAGVPQSRLNGLEQLITAAVGTETFVIFLEKWEAEQRFPV